MILICFTKFVKGWQRERERGRERERERERESISYEHLCGRQGYYCQILLLTLDKSI